MALTLSAAPSGLPDLRIQLVHLHWGSTAGITPSTFHYREGHSGLTSHGSVWESGCLFPSPFAQDLRVRPAGPQLQPQAQPYQQGQLLPRRPLGEYLSSASAVLLFSLLHADTAAVVRPALVLPGLAIAAAEAAVALAEAFGTPSAKTEQGHGFVYRDAAVQEVGSRPGSGRQSGAESQSEADQEPDERLQEALPHEAKTEVSGLAGRSAGLSVRVQRYGFPGLESNVRPLSSCTTDRSPASDAAATTRTRGRAARDASSGPSGAGLVPAAGTAAAVMAAPERGRGAARRAWRFLGLAGRQLGSLAGGVGRVANPLATALQRFMVPSALLSVAGRAWHVVHASSAGLADAVVDLVAVGLSYSCLAREAHLGRLPPGRLQEMAWRRLHKQAAQRLAHYLEDLPPTPPLEPALAAMDRLSIAAALAVDGVALCGTADTLAAGAAAAAAAAEAGSVAHGARPVRGSCWRTGGQQQLFLSVSYQCGGAARQHRQEQAGPGEGDVMATADASAGRCHGTKTQGPLGIDPLLSPSGSLCQLVPTHGSSDSGSGGAAITLVAAARTGPASVAADPTRSPSPPPPLRPTPSTAGALDAMPPPFMTMQPDPPGCGPATSLSDALSYRTLDTSADITAEITLSGDTGTSTPEPSRVDGTTPAPAAYLPASPLSYPLPSQDAAAGSCQTVPHTSAAAERGLPRAASTSILKALSAGAAGAAPAPAVSRLARIAAAVMSPLCRTVKCHGSQTPAGGAAALSSVDRAASGPSSSLVPSTSLPLPSSGAIVPDALPVACQHTSDGTEAVVLSSSGPTPRAATPAGGGPVTSIGVSGLRSRLGDWFQSAVEAAAAAAMGRPVADQRRRHHTSQQQQAQQSPHQLQEQQQQAVSHPLGCSASAFTTHGSSGSLELRNLSRTQAMQLLREEQLEAESLGLPLYGRADHAHLTELDRPTGVSERLDLACRAAYLVAVFLPFLTLGVTLVLLSLLVNDPTSPGAGPGPPATDASATPASSRGNTPTNAVPFNSIQDGACHTCNDGNGDVSDVTIRVTGGGRRSWRGAAAVGCRRAAWRMLLLGCRRSGAAFIKWGQWAATRVDLFPDDFCEALSELHDRAPTHSFAFTRHQVERSFGVALDSMFEAFDPQPVASGSIAQVHRALMRCSDGVPLEVAVKVVHPRVELRIQQDFALLRPAAAALGRLRSLRSLSLPETVSQFSCTMTAQADLRVEAAHLRRFYINFARVAGQVTTPRPLPGLVRREVMVETWEPGRSVAHFIRHPGPLNTAVVCLGVDTYLKMLLQDNFVHTDLHPGNIMVRLLDPAGRLVALPGGGHGGCASSPAAARATTSFSSLSSSSSHTGSSPSSSPSSPWDGEPRVQLVLLDFGLAEELTPAVRHHFISFLHHLLRGDGAGAASHILRWTSRTQGCPDPPAFTADMTALAAARCNIHSAAGVDLDGVMKDVLRLARKHSVTIDSCYASLVIAVCVIVGFATSLDPGVNLVDAAVPALLAHSLTGKVVGRLYS